MTKADCRDMVLLVLYLYQTLPQLVPKATLDFAGKLGDKQVSTCYFCCRTPSEQVSAPQLKGDTMCIQACTAAIDIHLS